MEYCICGHEELEHAFYQDEDVCYVCSVSKGKYKHSFKLDNLKYIEDMAEEKGLV